MRLAFKFRNNALGEDFAKLDAPLIERVDVPDDPLGKDGMLVERDQLTQRLRSQTFGEDGIGRTVAFKYPMRYEPLGVPSASTSSAVLPNASASACANTLAISMS